MTDRVINGTRRFWSVAHQKVIMAWLEEHGIEPKFIPVTASFTFTGDTCLTQQHRHNEEGYVLVSGELEEPLTFAVHAPFPLSAEVTP